MNLTIIYGLLVFLTLMQCTRSQFYKLTCFSFEYNNFFMIGWLAFFIPTLIVAPISLLVFFIIYWFDNHPDIYRKITNIIKYIHRCFKNTSTIVFIPIKYIFKKLFTPIYE